MEPTEPTDGETKVMKRDKDNSADSANIEQMINGNIAEALRVLRPQWRGRVEAEKSQKDSDGNRVQPDIKILYPQNPPVVIESEIHPNVSKVEKEASNRLGKVLAGDTREVEQAIALRIPNDLKNVIQDDLLEQVKNTKDFEYCVISEKGRWPEKGWIGGGWANFRNLSSKHLSQKAELSTARTD